MQYETIDADGFADIALRWEGVGKGFKKLTFDEAKADMDALMSAVLKQDALVRRISELESMVLKKNADVDAFMTEVSRLTIKYSLT